MGFLHKRERGAVAVEFAFVFPILLLLVYGVITYSYLFFVTTAVHYAAQVGAEAAVAVAPDDDEDDYTTRVYAAAEAAARQSLSWMTAAQLARLTVVPALSEDAVVPTIIVRLQFNTGAPTPIFPVIDLPLVGTVPRFPDNVVATAAAAI